MKFYLYFMIFLCMHFSAFSQSFSLAGKVVDSLNTPIEFANVIVLNPATNAIASFAVTNDEGKFKIVLEQAKDYVLKVSFVGYNTFEQSFTAKKENSENIIIELSVASDFLDEVQVVHEMPVTMSGDTLIYKTEAFTNGRERKLGEVLNKLPGMEVDENGEVIVQGKKVGKVLVDGKPFFEGDTKMATKNIPANAVDRVQVLKDYNEVGPMNGVKGDGDLALNIQLKEGKKNMIFGDITLGVGPEKRYLGHSNLFYYSPQLNVNLIADANNVGELAFTMQDYFRFSGGLSNIGAKAGSEIRLSNDELGFPLADRENAQSLDSKLTAFNFNYKPNKKWAHSGFFIGSESDNVFGNISSRTYLREDGNNEELLTTSLNAFNRSGLLKYGLTYTPSSETYIKYNAFGKLTALESTNNLISQFSKASNVIMEMEQQQPYSIQQQLNIYHTISESDVLSFESSYSHNLQDPTLGIDSEENPFLGLLPLAVSDRYRLFQERNITTNQSKTEANYYRILNKKNHLNFSTGLNFSDQQMNSKIDQITQEGLSQTLDSSIFKNELSYQFTNIYGGISSKSKVGSFVFSPGLYYHHYQLRQAQRNAVTNQDVNLLLPSFYTQWSISSVQNLSFKYRLSAEFIDIQKLAEGIIITDYNALFAGNNFLKNGLFHTYNLYYSFFNFFSGMNIFSNLTYSRKKDDFSPTVNFEGLERINSLINIAPVNESLTAMFSLDKKFNLFQMKLSGNINAFNTNTIINEEANLNQSLNQNYKTAVKTTFFKKMDVTFGYEHQLNIYESSRASNTFTNYMPFIIAGCTFLKTLRLKN